jgi:hypothetical protein
VRPSTSNPGVGVMWNGEQHGIWAGPASAQEVQHGMISTRR